MASSKGSWAALALLLLVALASTAVNGDHKLSAGYYDKTCPNVQRVVRRVMAYKVAGEPAIAPAILRLFFHDCFVNGCDASVLLDGTYFSESEKDALPNASLRGFEVIDEIKSVLEHNCPATVSCADVLALASRDAVTMLGGPAWSMPLGRMDSRTADRDGAENLPSPRDNYTSLVSTFRERGLDARDMTALSGAHTVGMANCHNYRGRIYGTDGDTNIDPSFAETRRQTCPDGDNEGGMAPFDEQTPMTFDNAYYKDLIARRGLLSSDQALYGSGGRQDDLVEMYSRDGKRFAKDFAKAMVKMGNIRPSKGTTLEISVLLAVREEIPSRTMGHSMPTQGQGGLGIENLEIKNKCLMSKWLYRVKFLVGNGMSTRFGKIRG
ncbi:peroxidase 4 [Triticum aestivum]|uniref:peroxidase 4 n=1 Tax=Triticum aestivum TaxID=4565 RepID=UPI001D02691D|nr:peroxidase 4-like [Triticum aestivum]